MKRITIFILFIFIGLQGYNQTNDSTNLRFTEIQWVVLVSEDSAYKFTRFIEPDGKFYFSFGFEDSCFTQPSRSWEFDNKRNFIGIYDLDYRYAFKTIDTIYSYFPIKKQEINKYSPHIPYELAASYIMQQLGEPKVNNCDQNIIRILYPCEELRYSFSFQVFKIHYKEHSAYIYRITGISKDHNGMQIIQKDSARMKEQDVKRIKKLFKKISEIESQECREPGNPWILEYNIDGEYKRFIISHYCARWKRELKHLVLFVSGIVGPSRNYFGMWCSH